MSEKIVNDLKRSIEQRKQHKLLIDMFKLRVKQYFNDEHNIPVRVLTFGDTFCVERDVNVKNFFDTPRITIQVIYDFCNQFEVELKDIVNRDRYIFVFKDKDMKDPFLGY